MEARVSHLDELKEQLETAVAAQDFDSAARLRGEIEGIRRSAKVRDVEGAAQASYFQRQVPERPVGRPRPSTSSG